MSRSLAAFLTFKHSREDPASYELL